MAKSNLIANLRQYENNKGIDFFDPPISSTKVRKGIFAHRYKNGTINIAGTKFIDYSMREAINIWRQNN